MTKFYTDVFGWKCTAWGEEPYVMFQTAAISGGFYKTTEPIGGGRSISPALYATNISDLVPKIVAAGGVITRCNTLIDKNVGSWLGFSDTEGNPMSLFTSKVDDLIEVGTIEQKVLIAMTPLDAYETFLDAEKNTKTVCADAKTKCEIDRRPNGRLSVYDGFITGHVICFDTAKKLVQSWTAKDWPINHYSNVSISFDADEKTTGCWITLKHTGVPKAKLDGWAEGWYFFYWNKMKLVKTESATPPVKNTTKK